MTKQTFHNIYINSFEINENQSIDSFQENVQSLHSQNF